MKTILNNSACPPVPAKLPICYNKFLLFQLFSRSMRHKRNIKCQSKYQNQKRPAKRWFQGSRCLTSSDRILYLLIVSDTHKHTHIQFISLNITQYRRSIEFSRQTFVIVRKYSNSIGLPNTTLMRLLRVKRNFQPIALYKKFFNILYIAINKVYFYKYVKVSV